MIAGSKKAVDFGSPLSRQPAEVNTSCVVVVTFAQGFENVDYGVVVGRFEEFGDCGTFGRGVLGAP